MSLFKAREWWGTTAGEGEEYDLGCLCVANIDNNNNKADKIIVGSYHGFLRIYKPCPAKTESGWSGFKPEDVVCEMQLPQPILQIEAGRFVSASDALHLAVLHPRKLSVYSLAGTPGAVDHGTNYTLNLIYEHNMKRTTFNFCCGPFGGVKGKDFICVQSMDGTVTIFEQESFAFSRFLPGALLPGPIKFLPRTDSFVTVSSSRQLESYKYQVLAVATDVKSKDETHNIRSGKRVASEWTFNIGEQAIDLQVVNFTNAQPSIYVLGERNLFILSDTGKLQMMKKFDYTPTSFLPYPSVAENTINCLVSTNTNTLLVYRGTTLKWAAQLYSSPVQICLANISDLQGVIVTLDEDGHVQCSYLGTDPAMFSPPSAEIRELDYNDMDSEMQQLQKIIKQQQGKSFAPLPNAKPDDDIQIQVHIPPNLDSPSLAHEVEIQDEDPVPSITVKLSIKAKVVVNDVKLSIHAPVPLAINDSLITFSSIEPMHAAETQVTFYMKHAIVPTSLRAEVTAAFISVQGAPRIVYTPFRLPIKLIAKACMPVKNAAFKVTVDTNKDPVNLNDLFSDLIGVSSSGPGNALGFKYFGMDPVITVLASKSSQRYRLQCDDFAFLWMLLSEMVSRLSSHFHVGRGSDFKISYDGSLPLQEYFDVLDSHFEARLNEDKIQKMLSDRAAQFRSIQRRLLTRFKDKTPAPLANLDTLLDGTYRQILALADAVEDNRQSQIQTAAALSAATRMLNLLIGLWQNLNSDERAVLESALSPNVMTNGTQGWEEMTDAAVTHLLRTCLAKSSKDATINPAPLTILRDTTKLKKHIALLCDRLSKGAKLIVEGYSPGPLQAAASPAPTRTVSRGTSRASSGLGHSHKPLQTTLDSMRVKHVSADESDVPEGSRYGDQRGSHSKKNRSPATELPSLAGPGLPPLSDKAKRFMKKTPSEGLSELVPDLDELKEPTPDENSLLMNGGNEMVYGL